jgi:hypothetical protein
MSNRQTDPDDVPVGKFHIRLGDPDYRQRLATAAVVLGVDVRDRSHVALFYGRSLLKRIMKADEPDGGDEEVEIFKAPIDFATDDVEALAAACNVLKGSCCYDPDNPLVNPDFN